MDTMRAFMMGQASRNRELMVFDWDEAARRIVASGAKDAGAGLSGDWDWTGGTILRDGEPVTDSYTYLASTWATPELELDGGGVESCYRMQSETDGWDSDTKWPPSALAILRGEPATPEQHSTQT